MKKKYLNELVSGAAIRDDQGKIISRNYATKEEVQELLSRIEVLEQALQELQK